MQDKFVIKPVNKENIYIEDKDIDVCAITETQLSNSVKDQTVRGKLTLTRYRLE